MRGDYESLRVLLFDDERQRLDGIDRRLDALPETVAESLEVAVRRKPDTVVNAVFPVIGPAIRRALVEALRHMASDFDQALTDTLSLKALRWRFEAWRTGVPYAQVVLRQRLHYRVEHLFLIQSQSGLLLDHLSAPGAEAIDADAVAGMLTAIGQFVSDSVRAEGTSSLGSASVGEYRLLVSDGPDARLAALVKGVPPSGLSIRMDELSEELHTLHGKRLAALPDGTGGLLEPNLLADLHVMRDAGERRATPYRRWVFLALLAGLVGVVSYRLWTGWQWSRRVDAVRAELALWPGLIPLHVDSPARGELVVDGLYDPVSSDPRTRDWGMHVLWSLRPYMSLEPALVARRTARLLAVDPGLVQGPDSAGVLYLTGDVPFADWYRLHALSIAIPGVQRVDTSRLSYPDAGEIGATVTRIQRARIGFATGVEPDAAAEATLQTMLADIESLEARAARAGIAVRLHMFGLTDEPGGSLVNRDLRLRRAEWLAQRLAPALRPPTTARADLETLSALEFHGTARAALLRIDLQPTRQVTP